jgi:hypothetical protein
MANAFRLYALMTNSGQYLVEAVSVTFLDPLPEGGWLKWVPADSIVPA